MATAPKTNDHHTSAATHPVPELPRPKPEIKVMPDSDLDSMWRVEHYDADNDGGVAIAVFGGCGDAEGRARAYAEHLRSGQSEAARHLLALLRNCQAVPKRYPPADAYDAEHALDALLELLYGPRWREIERAVRRE